ncbi:MAG: spore germination protein [Clostridia bacterium]|nr:spore germination protein [Clostridia bacterium]
MNFLKNVFTTNEEKFSITSAEGMSEKTSIKVFTDMEENLKTIKNYFSSPLNSDIKIREFMTCGRKSFAVFIENLVNSELLNTHILAPLILLKKDAGSEDITKTLIVHNQVSTQTEFEKILLSVNMGDCALFIDGFDKCIICDVKFWVRRGVEPPVSEAVIYGPHEGFNENFKTNTALIRKIVRNENMICETVNVGNVSKTPCALIYMKNITDENTVNEIRHRLNNIDSDYIFQLGELEQYIEDSNYSLVPQFLTTERPDKAASELIEGKIVLILQGSPFALIAPVTAGEFITTVEDDYIRFPFANLIKVIRIIGIIMSFLLSGLYVATVNFHHEMIPTSLLFAIEASRNAVPLSAFGEILLMEIAFDIIREASIRVPSSIGSTLGIIGGLIIGQAAVEAKLVSPIAIIIVAAVGIGSFATPNYGFNMALRFSRYIYLILGATAGFFGITLGLVISAYILSHIKSLGVPLLSGTGSKSEDNFTGMFFKAPVWKREIRHKYLHAKQERTQAKISRKWVEPK